MITVITVLLMYIKHFSIHYMKLLLEMSVYRKMQIMNFLIETYPISIGHVFIKVLSMKQYHYLQIFSLSLLNCACGVNHL